MLRLAPMIINEAPLCEEKVVDNFGDKSGDFGIPFKIVMENQEISNGEIEILEKKEGEMNEKGVLVIQELWRVRE